MGIKDFISKLTSPPSEKDKVAGKDETGTILSSDLEDALMEQSTNGPYDSFNLNAELQNDEPALLVNRKPADEDYVSTIEPETVTL